MSLQGKKREPKDFTKKVGMFEANVISINPDREELEKILGAEVEKDPEYLGEFQPKDKDGNEVGNPVAKLNVTVWLEDVKSKAKFALNFTLLNKEMVSKDGSKKQYINTAGLTTWTDDTDNLKEWFTKRDYRVAKAGEADLYSFLRNWLAFDYKDVDTVLDLEWKKLINGNTTELKKMVNGEYAQTFVAMATVRLVEKDGEEKEYQGIYNRNFLPAYTLKFFRTTKFTPERLAILKEKDRESRDTKKNYVKAFEKFALEVSDEEYGCKDVYFLGELKDYNPDDFLQASNNVIEDSDTTY